jgi:hypothetical protein
LNVYLFAAPYRDKVNHPAVVLAHGNFVLTAAKKRGMVTNWT